MLHKGKLQAALNAKREQFSRHDNSFGEQLETLSAYTRIII